MEHGHGAVTVGSEMAGRREKPDRGEMPVLPYRPWSAYQDAQGTRQGCGSGQNYHSGILMMEQVMTPFTANAFYFCDPDGRTEFVQSRDVYPVDDGHRP